jgi:hypothetical protein
MLRTLSAFVALPEPVVLQQFAAPRSCVANTLLVACASLVPCAAVPWYLYGLKIAETQSALILNRIHLIAGLPPSPFRMERRPFYAAVEIVIAFSRDSLLKGTLMAQRETALLTVAPRNLSGLAAIFLLLAALFAVLNGQKMKALRANAATPHASVTVRGNEPISGTNGPQQGKTAAAEDRAVKAEAALAQAEKEKTDLKGKLDASEQKITELRQRTTGMQTNSNASAASTTTAPAENAQSPDLQSQVDDLRRQLDGAEKEKTLLAEKLQDAQDHPGQVKETPKTDARKRRDTAMVQRQTSSSHRAGVHGSVLAYNQAYNFVVLNLGARNGVEANSEMLVLRDGTLIGKIRISSVEPATAIGDIMTNSLARGVQVQPGDSVIYAGTNP